MYAQDNDGSTRKILVQGNQGKTAYLVYWALVLLTALFMGVFLTGILLAFIGSIRGEPAPGLSSAQGRSYALSL